MTTLRRTAMRRLLKRSGKKSTARRTVTVKFDDVTDIAWRRWRDHVEETLRKSGMRRGSAVTLAERALDLSTAAEAPLVPGIKPRRHDRAVYALIRAVMRDPTIPRSGKLAEIEKRAKATPSGSLNMSDRALRDLVDYMYPRAKRARARKRGSKRS